MSPPDVLKTESGRRFRDQAPVLFVRVRKQALICSRVGHQPRQERGELGIAYQNRLRPLGLRADAGAQREHCRTGAHSGLEIVWKVDIAGL